MTDRSSQHIDRSAATETVRVTVIRETGVTPMSSRKHEVCWDFGVPPREAPFEVVRDRRRARSHRVAARSVGGR